MTLLDDGYLDEPEVPPPYAGWQLDPTPHRLAWFGLGVCVGVLLLALLILGRVAIDGAAG